MVLTSGIPEPEKKKNWDYKILLTEFEVQKQSQRQKRLL